MALYSTKNAGYENNPRVEIFENAGLSFTCGRMTTGFSNTMMTYIIYFENIQLALRTLCKGCHRISIVLSVLMWTNENDLNTLRVDSCLPLGNYLRQSTFVHIRQMCFLLRARQYD